MVRILFAFYLTAALLLAGCSTTVRNTGSFSPPQSASERSTIESEQTESENVTAESQFDDEDILAEQTMREIYLAEEYFAYGVRANANSQWQEASYNFEKALSILANLSVDLEKENAVSYSYKKLLNEIRTDYKLTLLYLATIPGEASSSAFMERFSQIDDFEKLKAESVPADVEEEQEYDIPMVVNKEVENSIVYFQTISREFFQGALTRSGKYIPLMEKILEEEKIPHDIVFLPLIESGFKTNAYSWAHASGPWQFISSTGRAYGLNRTWWYDERRDFEKSTRAAARYLKWLYNRYDDWYLALAAYNGGPGRIDRAIKKLKTRDFWKIRKKLKRETRNYVPFFLAATIIAKNPEKYGFASYYEKPLSYTTVTIDKCLDLREVAKALGTTYSYLKELNPELLRKFTPAKKRKYVLRIPAEMEAMFWAQYRKFKAPENATWVRHKVRRGETLSSIARNYNVSIWPLVDANNIKNRHKLIAGQTILVPVPADKQYGQSNSKSSKSNRKYAANGNEYKVRRGDSLWEIARAFGTTVSQLRKFNSLSKRSKIYPGQVLKINASTGSGSGVTSTYKVRKGDTLGKIARRFGTTITELQRINSLRNASRITIGQLIRVPGKGGSESSSISDIIVYIVKSGDTLWEIAKRFSCSVQEIKRLNDLRSNRIRIGDKLRINKN